MACLSFDPPGLSLEPVSNDQVSDVFLPDARNPAENLLAKQLFDQLQASMDAGNLEMFSALVPDQKFHMLVRYSAGINRLPFYFGELLSENVKQVLSYIKNLIIRMKSDEFVTVDFDVPVFSPLECVKRVKERFEAALSTIASNIEVNYTAEATKLGLAGDLSLTEGEVSSLKEKFKGEFAKHYWGKDTLGEDETIEKCLSQINLIWFQKYAIEHRGEPKPVAKFLNEEPVASSMMELFQYNTFAEVSSLVALQGVRDHISSVLIAIPEPVGAADLRGHSENIVFLNLIQGILEDIIKVGQGFELEAEGKFRQIMASRNPIGTLSDSEFRHQLYGIDRCAANVFAGDCLHYVSINQPSFLRKNGEAFSLDEDALRTVIRDEYNHRIQFVLKAFVDGSFDAASELCLAEVRRVTEPSDSFVLSSCQWRAPRGTEGGFIQSGILGPIDEEYNVQRQIRWDALLNTLLPEVKAQIVSGGNSIEEVLSSGDTFNLVRPEFIGNWLQFGFSPAMRANSESLFHRVIEMNSAEYSMIFTRHLIKSGVHFTPLPSASLPGERCISLSSLAELYSMLEGSSPQDIDIREKQAKLLANIEFLAKNPESGLSIEGFCTQFISKFFPVEPLDPFMLVFLRKVLFCGLIYEEVGDSTVLDQLKLLFANSFDFLSSKVEFDMLVRQEVSTKPSELFHQVSAWLNDAITTFYMNSDLTDSRREYRREIKERLTSESFRDSNNKTTRNSMLSSAMLQVLHGRVSELEAELARLRSEALPVRTPAPPSPPVLPAPVPPALPAPVPVLPAPAPATQPVTNTPPPRPFQQLRVSPPNSTASPDVVPK